MTIRAGLCAGTFGLFTVVMACPASSQTAGNWAGPYLGVFGQGVTGRSTQTDPGYTPPTVTPPPSENGPFPVNTGLGDGRYRMHGAAGGALAGYNMQYGQFVVGLEADLAGGNVSGKSRACGASFGVPHECGTSTDLMGTIRGRLGYDLGSFLPFVSGGLAYNQITSYDSYFLQGNKQLRAGWTVGGGVDIKLAPAWSLRLEYLHTQFDKWHAYDIVSGVPESVRLSTDTYRAGITYHFSTP